jgi:hypothetical protein
MSADITQVAGVADEVIPKSDSGRFERKGELQRKWASSALIPVKAYATVQHCAVFVHSRTTHLPTPTDAQADTHAAGR